MDISRQNRETKLTGIASNIKIKPNMLSTSFMLMRGVLSLPIYPELTDNEVEYIVNKVKEFYKHA